MLILVYVWCVLGALLVVVTRSPSLPLSQNVREKEAGKEGK